MVLESYLKKNNTSIRQVHLASGIPETTLRNISKRKIDKWSMVYFDAIAKTIGKNNFMIIKELQDLEHSLRSTQNGLQGRYNLENRRYIGNKCKLLHWISDLLDEYTKGDSFFDVFAGTGIVSKSVLHKYRRIIMNDFLFSNNVIFKAFFGKEGYDKQRLQNYLYKFQKIQTNSLDDDYFAENYGGRFFSSKDAKVIGEIRSQIENGHDLNDRERSILIASLIYSADKIANTVGHYDAYRKNVDINDRFLFELINPIDVSNTDIEIYREDSNKLIRNISADIAFVDPPYNSRQYSRFYHVLEGITKWDKPVLEGVAMKPPAENMSEYSKSNAPKVFDDLIKNLNSKYIVVTYNNTYNSKSSSSRNKITHEEILESLDSVGKTRSFEIPFQYFNAGKTELNNHKEFIFVTEVKK